MDSPGFSKLDQAARALIIPHSIDKYLFDAIRILPQTAGNRMKTKDKASAGHNSLLTNLKTLPSIARHEEYSMKKSSVLPLNSDFPTHYKPLLITGYCKTI